MRRPMSLTVGLLALAIMPAVAGGFGISVELPKPGDERTKDALVLVRAVGCMGPGASLTVRAEGYVDGKLKSIPLKIWKVGEPESNSGYQTYAVTRQLPGFTGGAVLVATALKEWESQGKTSTIHTTMLVELEPGNKVHMVKRPNTRGWDEAVKLADGKTRILRWACGDGKQVPATSLVSGDVEEAARYLLSSKSVAKRD